MALSDKKALLVLPPRDFEFKEYEITRKALESNGVKVEIASSFPGGHRSTSGRFAYCDKRIKDVKYYDYDAIVFVGGPGAKMFFDDEDVKKLAKDAEYKILGAISTAPGILAAAGVLKEKMATGDTSIAGTLESNGATFTNRPLQVDGKIVTAKDSRVAPHFAAAVVELLKS